MAWTKEQRLAAWNKFHAESSAKSPPQTEEAIAQSFLEFEKKFEPKITILLKKANIANVDGLQPTGFSITEPMMTEILQEKSTESITYKRNSQDFIGALRSFGFYIDPLHTTGPVKLFKNVNDFYADKLASLLKDGVSTIDINGIVENNFNLDQANIKEDYIKHIRAQGKVVIEDASQIRIFNNTTVAAHFTQYQQLLLTSKILHIRNLAPEGHTLKPALLGATAE